MIPSIRFMILLHIHIFILCSLIIRVKSKSLLATLVLWHGLEWSLVAWEGCLTRTHSHPWPWDPSASTCHEHASCFCYVGFTLHQDVLECLEESDKVSRYKSLVLTLQSYSQQYVGSLLLSYLHDSGPQVQCRPAWMDIGGLALVQLCLRRSHLSEKEDA